MIIGAQLLDVSYRGRNWLNIANWPRKVPSYKHDVQYGVHLERRDIKYGDTQRISRTVQLAVFFCNLPYVRCV